MRIALIDYGAGNLTSVKKALAAVGADVVVPRDPSELAQAAAVIVPGVGHFQATAALDERWREAILASVAAGRPLLGICLGMQWLFDGSAEAPDIPGLGILSGRCELLGRGALADRPGGFRTMVGPDLERGPQVSLLTRGDPCTPPSLKPGPRLPAFRAGVRARSSLTGPPASGPQSPLKVPHVGWNSLHVIRSSALLEGIDDGAQVYFTHSYAAPITADCVASTIHGDQFAAVVERECIFGVQFHPEKSGDVGLRILKNFLGKRTAVQVPPGRFNQQGD